MKAIIRDGGEREKTHGLNQLAEMLEEAGFSVEQTDTYVLPGRKDGGVILGLAIAGLVVSSIGTLLGVLGYYKKRDPHRSVEISWKDIQISINDFSSKQIQHIEGRFRSMSDVEEIVIRIE